MPVTLPSLTAAALPVLACLALGCGASTSMNPAPRPVTGLPDHFVVDGPTPSASGRACIVHLKSQVDDTRLTLRTSSDNGSAGISGDYQVEPPGRYGMAGSELLRLDCLTNRAIGAVRGRR
jgi:hypothetical protein